MIDDDVIGSECSARRCRWKIDPSDHRIGRAGGRARPARRSARSAQTLLRVDRPHWRPLRIALRKHKIYINQFNNSINISCFQVKQIVMIYCKILKFIFKNWKILKFTVKYWNLLFFKLKNTEIYFFFNWKILKFTFF